MLLRRVLFLTFLTTFLAGSLGNFALRAEISPFVKKYEKKLNKINGSPDLTDTAKINAFFILIEKLLEDKESSREDKQSMFDKLCGFLKPLLIKKKEKATQNENEALLEKLDALDIRLDEYHAIFFKPLPLPPPPQEPSFLSRHKGKFLFGAVVLLMCYVLSGDNPPPPRGNGGRDPNNIPPDGDGVGGHRHAQQDRNENDAQRIARNFFNRNNRAEDISAEDRARFDAIGNGWEEFAREVDEINNISRQARSRRQRRVGNHARNDRVPDPDIFFDRDNAGGEVNNIDDENGMDDVLNRNRRGAVQQSQALKEFHEDVDVKTFLAWQAARDNFSWDIAPHQTKYAPYLTKLREIKAKYDAQDYSKCTPAELLEVKSLMKKMLDLKEEIAGSRYYGNEHEVKESERPERACAFCLELVKDDCRIASMQCCKYKQFLCGCCYKKISTGPEQENKCCHCRAVKPQAVLQSYVEFVAAKKKAEEEAAKKKAEEETKKKAEAQAQQNNQKNKGK